MSPTFWIGLAQTGHHRLWTVPRILSLIRDFLNPLIQASDNKPVDPSESSQTFVYPVSQFTPLLKPKDTSTEYTAVTTILRMLSSSPAFAGARWLFTAGCFNIHPVLSSLLISSTSAAQHNPSTTQGTVLTASPWANGFYSSQESQACSSRLHPPRRTIPRPCRRGAGYQFHSAQGMAQGHCWHARRLDLPRQGPLGHPA